MARHYGANALAFWLVGPVLLSALRRLASICLRDVIVRSQQWVRFFIGEGTMPFGLARRFTRPVADLPQSAIAIAINFQSGP